MFESAKSYTTSTRLNESPSFTTGCSIPGERRPSSISSVISSFHPFPQLQRHPTFPKAQSSIISLKNSTPKSSSMKPVINKLLSDSSPETTDAARLITSPSSISSSPYHKRALSSRTTGLFARTKSFSAESEEINQTSILPSKKDESGSMLLARSVLSSQFQIIQHLLQDLT